VFLVLGFQQGGADLVAMPWRNGILKKINGALHSLFKNLFVLGPFVSSVRSSVGRRARGDGCSSHAVWY
jgi:hypothetical protein